VNPRSMLCPDCAIEAVRESVKQLKAKKGPIYYRWKVGLLNAIQEEEESDVTTPVES